MIKGQEGGPTSIGRCGNTSIQVLNVKAAVVLCKDYSYNSKFINSGTGIGQSHREDQFDDEPSVKYFFFLLMIVQEEISILQRILRNFFFVCLLLLSLALQCASVLQKGIVLNGDQL